MLIVCSIILLSTRAVFNNSVGNSINFSIEESALDRFFSARDLFLYAVISLGTIISSIISVVFPLFIGYFIASNGTEIFLISTVFILVSTVCAKAMLPEKQGCSSA